MHSSDFAKIFDDTPLGQVLVYYKNTGEKSLSLCVACVTSPLNVFEQLEYVAQIYTGDDAEARRTEAFQALTREVAIEGLMAQMPIYQIPSIQ